MAKITSSRSRYKRRASKRPTSSKTRPTRSRASTAKVTRSGEGSRFGSAKTTRDSMRTQGKAKVTGSGTKPTQKALPAGKKGGAIVKAGTGAPRPQLRLRGAAPRFRGGRVGGAAAAAAIASELLKRDPKLGKDYTRAVEKFEADRADVERRLTQTAKRLFGGQRKGQGTGQGNRRTRTQPKTTAPKSTTRKLSNLPANYKKQEQEQARKARPTAQTKPASKPTTSTTKPKTKPTPRKPTTSGVGPVKSGRSYSTQVSGKSVLRQQVDQLKAMRERSKKRQEQQKKKTK